MLIEENSNFIFDPTAIAISSPELVHLPESMDVRLSNSRPWKVTHLQINQRTWNFESNQTAALARELGHIYLN